MIDNHYACSRARRFSWTQAACTVAAAMLLICTTCMQASADPPELIKHSLEVLKDIGNIPEQEIPAELMGKCMGIAVFPSVYKGGFWVGASYGKGLMVVRDPMTGKWNGPVFLSIGSSSFGLQIGFQKSELILVIMNLRGVRSFFTNNVTLGGDISVAAGPVGRHLSASTDITLNAAVYSYSKTKGLFGGLALKGAFIRHDYAEDELLYGRPLTPHEILSGRTRSVPDIARRLLNFLDRKYPYHP